MKYSTAALAVVVADEERGFVDPGLESIGQCCKLLDSAVRANGCLRDRFATLSVKPLDTHDEP